MNGKGAYTLAPGHYVYPFAYQLPYDLPPSFRKEIADDFASIMYYAKAYVDIPNGRDAVSKCFFSVIRPIPMTQWLVKHPLSVNRVFPVTMCCCIDKGTVVGEISMDRSVIAIDRDWLQVFAVIDNTRGEEPVLNLEVSLRHTLTYSVGHVRETNSYTAGKRFVGTSVPAGQRGVITGIVDLPANLMPSFTTPNVQSRYVISVELNIPWATDPCITFPVFIAQSVDESNVTPPVSFDAVGRTQFTAGRRPCTEYYYAPPPMTVCEYQPAMGFSSAPPGAQYLPPPQIPQQQHMLALPSRQWTQSNQPPAPEGCTNMQINWQHGGGYGQPIADHYIMPPPPQGPPPAGGNGGEMMNVNAPYGGQQPLPPNVYRGAAGDAATPSGTAAALGGGGASSPTKKNDEYATSAPPPHVNYGYDASQQQQPNSNKNSAPSPSSPHQQQQQQQNNYYPTAGNNNYNNNNNGYGGPQQQHNVSSSPTKPQGGGGGGGSYYVANSAAPPNNNNNNSHQGYQMPSYGQQQNNPPQQQQQQQSSYGQPSYDYNNNGNAGGYGYNNNGNTSYNNNNNPQQYTY